MDEGPLLRRDRPFRTEPEGPGRLRHLTPSPQRHSVSRHDDWEGVRTLRRRPTGVHVSTLGDPLPSGPLLNLPGVTLSQGTYKAEEDLRLRYGYCDPAPPPGPPRHPVVGGRQTLKSLQVRGGG